MASRKVRRKKHVQELRLRGLAYSVGALALLAVLYAFYAVHTGNNLTSTIVSTSIPTSTTTSMPVSQTNQSWGDAGTVHQYDGGINHTYYVNEDIGNINVSLNDTIMGPITVYKKLLLVTTAGPYHDQLIADYNKTPGSLTAIDAYTGDVLWRDYFPNQIIGQPVVVDNTIIVSMSNNEEIQPQNFTKFNNPIDRVYAVNLTTGGIIWNFNLSAPSMLTPSYFEGSIFLPTMGGYLVANSTTGNVTYSIWYGLADTMSSPLLINDKVYFGAGLTHGYTSVPITGNYSFFSVNATTGKIIWVKNFTEAGSGMNDVTPGYYKGVVITGYLNHSMYTNPILIGLNSSNGDLLWKVDEIAETHVMNITEPSTVYGGSEPLTEPTMSAITMYNGIAYADSNFVGVLFAVNATTGKVLWMFNTGQCESNPNIHDGYLYIMNDIGILYVLNATTGVQINEVNTGMHHLSNELTITKNNLIVSSLQGNVITIPLSSLTGSGQ